MKTPLTLSFIMKDDKILLGMKKRGFGKGRWNGFGGKLEKGETLEEAAKREIKEESGIEAGTLEKRAINTFCFPESHKNVVLEVHTFLVTSWSGEPEETEEMKPQWFPLSDIPYADMWSDDQYWLPLFLEGKFLTTKFTFDKNDQVVEYEVDSTHTGLTLGNHL